MTLYEGDMSNTSDEYPTKPDLWRPLRRSVGGFDLDPASGAEPDPIAEEQFSEADDGLHQNWHGTVWLNPPFSDKVRWYQKLVREIEEGRVKTGVALAPVDTSTQWFQNWFSRANCICWLEGRDWYIADGSPSFNTAVGVFGKVPGKTVKVLGEKGIITTVYDPRDSTQMSVSDF